ncbi:unnamed protein product [Ilex paraguariensis]|uniref:UBC core domain-containing protein n=1 Tax=Ilex paraguariensis TaxID=185542 RepID=A0ABC8SX50_9AQUA
MVTQVYHPNIDLEGNVFLNILREDWKPVLNISTIIYGLYHLFMEPNHEDPLNPDAAAMLRDNQKVFESNVRRAMVGGYEGQSFFPRCLYSLKAASSLMHITDEGKEQVHMVEMIKDKGPMWDEIVRDNKLVPTKMEEVGGWWFANIAFPSLSFSIN